MTAVFVLGVEHLYLKGVLTLIPEGVERQYIAEAIAPREVNTSYLYFLFIKGRHKRINTDIS